MSSAGKGRPAYKPARPELDFLHERFDPAQALAEELQVPFPAAEIKDSIQQCASYLDPSDPLYKPPPAHKLAAGQPSRAIGRAGPAAAPASAAADGAPGRRRAQAAASPRRLLLMRQRRATRSARRPV